LRGTKRSITRWPADLQLRCQPTVSCRGRGHASGTTHPMRHRLPLALEAGGRAGHGSGPGDGLGGTRTLLKMAGPVRAEVSVSAWEAADRLLVTVLRRRWKTQTRALTSLLGSPANAVGDALHEVTPVLEASTGAPAKHPSPHPPQQISPTSSAEPTPRTASNSSAAPWPGSSVKEHLTSTLCRAVHDLRATGARAHRRHLCPTLNAPERQARWSGGSGWCWTWRVPERCSRCGESLSEREAATSDRPTRSA
jgi:hypothetical protein